MKPITRDISLTILIKLLFLFLLWWFCVKGKHFVINSPSEWLLGQQELSSTSQTVPNSKNDNLSIR